jgi:maltose alpha-D-glucosyltransferase/alpha-amylase
VDRKLPAGVLAHRADGTTGTMLFLHNLGPDDVTVDLSELSAQADEPNQVFGDQDYAPVGRLDALDLAGYGYRWIRLCRNSGT